MLGVAHVMEETAETPGGREASTHDCPRSVVTRMNPLLLLAGAV
jgi:hypothetical protein